MKNQLKQNITLRYQLLASALALSLALPMPTLAATVALANAPLATATTTSVKPNLMLIFDNSGSMDWDHMPDDDGDGGSDVPFSFGYYGIRSAQCNQVYYDPTYTYTAAVNSAGNPMTNASFTGAWTDAFNTGAGIVSLQTGFTANQSGTGGNAGGTDAAGTIAYYYNYSGAQTTQLLKNYNSTTNTFVKECGAAKFGADATPVFTKIELSNAAASSTATIKLAGTAAATTVSSIKINGVELMTGTSTSASTFASIANNIAAKIGNGYTATSNGVDTVTINTGVAASASSLIVTSSATTVTFDRTIKPITDTAKLQNFANWYSYYRTRLLMMKTAAGQSFSTLSNSYRVGLSRISNTNPTQLVGTFETTNRDNWYAALYGTTTSGSTPLRTALSNAGRYFAGKLAVTDPVQYSCQQNFAILSTDGYWNAGNDINLTGASEVIGNQDGNLAKPFWDGATAANSVTTTYTRNTYSETRTAVSGLNADKCNSGFSRITVTPETQTCTVVGGVSTCGSWAAGTKAYKAPYTNAKATCVADTTIAAPATSAATVVGTPITSTAASGGSSDSLADVAMYYYQTDLRTSALGNCGTTTTSDPEGLCNNNVFISGNDNQQQQHMTTFTLGLGASGWMNYSTSYLSDTTGATTPACDSAPDYVAVKLGCVAKSTVTPKVCSWQADGTTCAWPLPGMNGTSGLIANIDDLWHAAVDGHGAYFSATNPSTLSIGLSNALSGINSRKGSASAAATSTLNPVAGNNFAYFASYTTQTWKGNLEARGINTDDGTISENATWCVENVVADVCPVGSQIVAKDTGDTTIYNCVTPSAVICTNGTIDTNGDCLVPIATACTGTMQSLVFDTNDNRHIKTPNPAGTTLVEFDSTYPTTEFSALKISTLAQWSTLTATQKTAAAGTNLINYIRGQRGYEDRTANLVDNRLYRYREATLGDALESQPQYLGAPHFGYPYPGYSAFATANAARKETVFMGTNDGMVHAFYAHDKSSYTSPAKCVVGAVAGEYCGGEEAWAYIPSMVIPNLWHLADTNYSTNHVNYVNGSVVRGDVCTANCTDSATAVWKTIMVGGLNAGGRGYYALDVTVPDAPVLLWELTTSAGTGLRKDDDIGYSYGVPLITQKENGTWVVVVTSGYNNVSTGTGKGYLYVLDAGTGVILNKITTGAGNTTTPSGLAKIAGWNNEPGGNKVGYIYGGDLLGNLWRFDINSTTSATAGCSECVGTGTSFLFATLKGSDGFPQPVMTKPILASIHNKRVVFVGTGKYLENSDLTNTNKQSYYAIKDADATTTLTNARTGLVSQTMTNNPDGTATRIISSTNTVDFYVDRGWYIDFIDTGERVNIDSKLIFGTLVIPSIVPANTACTPGGYGWINFLDYLTGTAVTSDKLSSSKFDSPVVGINEMYIDGDPVMGVVTAGGGIEKSKKVPTNTSTGGFLNRRSIWREMMP